MAFVMSTCYFQKQVIWLGMALAGLVLIYFAGLNFVPDKWKKWIPKEVVIAMVYAGGIWFIPLMYSTQILSAPFYIFLLIFTGLVWCEGAMASWFEYESDLKDGHHSFTTTVGLVRGKLIITTTLIASILMLMVMLYMGDYPLMSYATLFILCINLGLLLIMLFPGYFAQNSRYRIVGESLFLIPALILFL